IRILDIAYPSDLRVRIVHVRPVFSSVLSKTGGAPMQMILVSCLLTATMLFVVLAIALRLLPTATNSFTTIMHSVLVLSVRFYYLMLSHISPWLDDRFGIDLLRGLWRLTSCILLSQLFGILFLLLAAWEISGWSVVLFTLHGMVVGMVWDEV